MICVVWLFFNNKIKMGNKSSKTSSTSTSAAVTFGIGPTPSPVVSQAAPSPTSPAPSANSVPVPAPTSSAKPPPPSQFFGNKPPASASTLKTESAVILFDTMATYATNIAGPIASPIKIVSLASKIVFYSSTTDSQKIMFESISLSLAQFYKEMAYIYFYEEYTQKVLKLSKPIKVDTKLIHALKENIGELFAFLFPLLETQKTPFYKRIFNMFNRMGKRTTLLNLIVQNYSTINLVMDAINTSVREQLQFFQVSDPQNYNQMIEKAFKVIEDFDPTSINEKPITEIQQELDGVFAKVEGNIESILQASSIVSSSNPSFGSAPTSAPTVAPTSAPTVATTSASSSTNTKRPGGGGKRKRRKHTKRFKHHRKRTKSLKLS